MAQEQMSFEQALSRLDEIVKLLERGDAPLEASLELFEEGTALVRRCTAALEKAEQRVTILLKQENGDIQEQIFDGSMADAKTT